MFNDFRYKLAIFIAPSLEKEVYQRALALAPKVMIEEYACQFYGSKDNPDDGMSDDERRELETWAYSNVKNPNFKLFLRWCIDVQANYALRHAATERIADFGRATINALELFEDEVERLSVNFERRNKPVEYFDENNTGISDNI